MRLKVTNKYWKIKLQNPDEFHAELGADGADAGALTDIENRTVYFLTTDFNENYVRHELFHVYFSLAFVNSANLDMSQTEEVAAEIMGMYGEEYITNCRKVYEWLKKESTKLSKK